MEVSKNKLHLYLFATIFAFVLFLGQASASEYENYYGITMTNQQYNNLINLGFNENEIYYMDEDTFETNKDVSATLVAENQKYFKTTYTGLDGNAYTTEITESEYNNQSLMDARGTVTTEYKTMVTTLSKLTNTFRYKVSVAWNKLPSVRSYDIIGIGFDDDVHISSSLYFGYNYCVSSGNCTTSSLYYFRQTTASGGSVVYKLPGDEAKSISSYLYYDVSKNTTSTITRLDMYGDYAHATTAVSATTASNHGISLAGIELTSNISYYDAIPCAVSSWAGTW